MFAAHDTTKCRYPAPPEPPTVRRRRRPPLSRLAARLCATPALIIRGDGLTTSNRSSSAIPGRRCCLRWASGMRCPGGS
jgi:hypothetical protein